MSERKLRAEIIKLMKIADTRHDGGPDKGHGVDYDVVVILRFFPATAGDEVGTA